MKLKVGKCYADVRPGFKDKELCFEVLGVVRSHLYDEPIAIHQVLWRGFAQPIYLHHGSLDRDGVREITPAEFREARDLIYEDNRRREEQWLQQEQEQDYP